MLKFKKYFMLVSLFITVSCGGRLRLYDENQENGIYVPEDQEENQGDNQTYSQADGAGDSDGFLPGDGSVLDGGVWSGNNGDSGSNNGDSSDFGSGDSGDNDWVGDSVLSSDTDVGNNVDEECVLICHIPPGNSDNKHDICVDEESVSAHLDHGDCLEECDVCHEEESEEKQNKKCKRKKDKRHKHKK